jgi:hypothetical protein
MVNLTVIAVLGTAMFLFQESLEKIAHIELPGPKGQRFDYLTVDSEDHYLLSAHLGPGILYVIDMRTNKLVKAIQGRQVSPVSSTSTGCTRCTPPTGAKRRSA